MIKDGITHNGDFCAKQSQARSYRAALLTREKPLPSATSIVTAHEREILTRIAQGHSNKMVAREFGRSPKTIAKHRANLMRKLLQHNAAAINHVRDTARAGGDPVEVQIATQVSALA